MTPSRFLVIVFVALAAGLVFPAATRADERATIVNDSYLNVEFYVKWSDIPFWSPKIVLAPGESYTTSGPDRGRLLLSYNTTPGRYPARVSRVVILTARAYAPWQTGYVSYFRAQSPIQIQLYAY